MRMDRQAGGWMYNNNNNNNKNKDFYIAPYLYALGANNSRVTIKTPQVDR